MMTRRAVKGWLLALAASLPTASGGEPRAKPPLPMPSPDLSPAQVMEIQIEALQYVDRPDKDAGIATTFRFASPANREATGPLERFALIVKGPAFQPLINHRVAGYDPVVVNGTHASRRVTVVAADGRAVEYEFQLSKDAGTGCWFTDGVVPLPGAVPINPGKVALNAQVTLIAASE